MTRPRLSGAGAGRPNDFLRLRPVTKSTRLGRFPLEVLVDLKEMLDLVTQRRRDIVDVRDVAPGRVVERNTQHLLVRPLLVRHVEDADRAHADAAARERRLADEYERVERVAVLA